MVLEDGAQVEYRYWAFISHSSDDRRLVKRLHHRIETYLVPKELIGRRLPVGEPTPRRFQPVFYYRADLAASSSLQDKVFDALRGSRYLIVVCSPSAARSPWVTKEVDYFCSLGRRDRALAIIVKGRPNSGSDLECFPPVLRAFQPGAPDIRRSGDGATDARLKLLAAMLGVEFDALRQRETIRQLRRLQVVAAASLVLILTLASLTAYALNARATAERLRRSDRLSAYVARIQSAVADIQLADSQSATRQLERCPLEERGPEWDLLWQRVHPHRLFIPSDRPLSSVAVCTGLKLFAVSTYDGRIEIRDIDSGDTQASLNAGAEIVQLRLATGRPPVLVAAATGGQVFCWDLSLITNPRVVRNLALGPGGLAISTDCSLIAHSSNGTLEVINLLQGVTLWSMENTPDEISFRFDEEGQHLFLLEPREEKQETKSRLRVYLSRKGTEVRRIDLPVAISSIEYVDARFMSCCLTSNASGGVSQSGMLIIDRNSSKSTLLRTSAMIQAIMPNVASGYAIGYARMGAGMFPLGGGQPHAILGAPDIRGADLDRQSHELFVASRDGVRIISLRRGAPDIDIHVDGCKVSPDGSFLAFGIIALQPFMLSTPGQWLRSPPFGTVLVFSDRYGTESKKVTIPSGEFLADLDVFQDGRVAAALVKAEPAVSRVLLMDSSGSELRAIAPLSGSIVSMQLSLDGRTLVVGLVHRGGDGHPLSKVELIDVQAGTVLKSLNVGSELVRSVALSDDASRVACCGSMMEVLIWTCADGLIERRLPVASGEDGLFDLDFGDNGLIAAVGDGGLWLWRPGEAPKNYSLDGATPTEVRVFPRSERVYLRTQERGALIWHIPAEEEILAFPTAATLGGAWSHSHNYLTTDVTGVAISPEGRWFAVDTPMRFFLLNTESSR